MELGPRIRMLSPFNITILLLFVIVAANIPIAETLARYSFDDGTYSHAYLIPFITLYLYFNLAKYRLIQYRVTPNIFALGLLGLSCFGLFVATNAQISTIYWLAYVAIFVFTVNAIFKFSWYAIFPAAYLIFIVPVWGALITVLQNISTYVVTFLMGFSGIPTYVEGQIITIPAGVFEIADGCSGLRYFIVSLAISSLFIFLYIKNTKKAILFISVAIAGALVTNWIRITALILIGEYTNMQSPLMEDHNTFGWYLYIPFMVGLFYWGNKIADNDLFSLTTEPASTKPYPNMTTVVAVLVMITASSSTLRALPLTTFLAPATIVGVKKAIYPEIYYATSVDDFSENGIDNSTYLIYNFDGNDLNSKASFYLNSVVPEGWSEESTFEHGGWQKIIVSNSKRKTCISVQYQVGSAKTPSIGKLKTLRLKYAIKNIRETQLHWKFEFDLASCAVR